MLLKSIYNGIILALQLRETSERLNTNRHRKGGGNID